jgi:dienelactone hydrolase
MKRCRVRWSCCYPLTLLAGFVSFAPGAFCRATPIVTELAARYSSGQVFLTWNEATVSSRTTFEVYSHDVQIQTESFAGARRVAHHVERQSARDWWRDAAFFTAGAAPGSARGFVVATGEAPLDPRDGLFVHTIMDEDTTGPRYYAVLATQDGAPDERSLVLGDNSLTEPLTGRVSLPHPLWLANDVPEPQQGSARGKGLLLILHGRGGGHASVGRPGAHSALAFGDAKQGWRQGLPYKFRVDIGDELVSIRPYDCTWVGRELTESIDPWYRAHVIVSWWYGYDRNIFTSIDDGPTVAPNYTEERLLYLIRWAQGYLGTDPQRVYLRGGSMGGSGAVSMALHHPERFAAVKADVAIVAYTCAGKRGSLWRLECVMGALDDSAVNHEGVPLLEHMNGSHIARTTTADLPPLFMTHGRRDSSIPWVNNPPFYRAMNEAHQSLTVYWDNGGHSRKNETPEDVAAWAEGLYRYRLDESFLVFSNASHNRDPGGGDAEDGDLVGWYNRGLDWKDLHETRDDYSFTVTFACPGVDGPVKVDVTLRRLQRFRLRPGDVLQVRVGDSEASAVWVDSAGVLTIPRITVEAGPGTAVAVTR